MKTHRRTSIARPLATAAAVMAGASGWLSAPPAGLAQKFPTAVPNESTPGILNDVGIDQKLGSQLPLDAPFRDEYGNDVKVKDYFGKRPVVLAFVYFECPMLCTMELNGLLRGLNGLRSKTVGEDFDVLVISFDPRETPDLAQKKKRTYVKEYGQRGDPAGWHFLTGPQSSIAAVTSAAGFRYAWDEKSKQYAHASGIMVLTPDGKFSRYLYNIEYAPEDIRQCVEDAAGSKIGAPTQQVIFYCFHYDPTTGRYGVFVDRLLKASAVGMMGLIGAFWLVSSRRTGRGPATPPPPGAGGGASA